MLESLAAWIPLIVILAIFLLFLRYTKRTREKYMGDMQKMNEDVINLNREMVAQLREIKEILRDRA